MNLSLYNTRSRQIEVFQPLYDKKVTIYVCGVTPYDASHLGHAFTFIVFDTFVRLLRFLQYDVTYVQNITDVDDDILRRAREEKTDWRSLGERWIQDLLSDFDFLHIHRPDKMPKASEVIDEIIVMTQVLLKKAHAYEVEGNVYFPVDSFKNYGSFSRLSHEQMLKISTIRGNDITDKRKKNPLDFVLWQKSLADEPSWDSPWGQGRPGWHIECSSMSMKFLSEQIDIHGGGSDLIFPHHESEIAQSVSYTEKSPFVKYWMHCGMVLFESEKMSKSLGNLIFVKDLREKYSANSIRYYLLSNHYRRPWEYIEEDLIEAQTIVQKIEKKLSSNIDYLKSNIQLPSAFITALCHDFNAPAALTLLKHCKDPKQLAAMWQLLGFM